MLAPLFKEIGKFLVGSISRQFSYLFCTKKHVQNMSILVQNLVTVRDRLQQQVDEARSFGQEIRPDVLEFLEFAAGAVAKAEALMKEMDSNKKCLHGCCVDMGSRSKLSKEAIEVSKIIAELVGREYAENVSLTIMPPPLSAELVSVVLPTNPPGIVSSSDFIAFESTKTTMNRIILTLEEEGCDIVGVVGMGGVGKTTLVKEVARTVKEDKTSDQVVMVVVSQTQDIRKIQGELASRLNLSLNQDGDEHGRAAQLYERLLKVECILVILDDVWGWLDLNAVGIPHGAKHKGCKIVLTTRKEDFCTIMGIGRRYIIHVNLLLKEESWQLFRKHAGPAIDSPPLKSIAQDVIAECEGLPIALAAVGRALRDKDNGDWSAAYLQLKNSRSSLIESMDQVVYPCLRLSYNYLRDEEAESCFLLCCLFPEDYDINVEDIVRYAMGKGSLFDYVDTIAEARKLVVATVKRLKASCLLLKSDKQDCVKMHDMVRDVAISIASEGENHFLIRAGVGMTEWPARKRNSFKEYRGISLMANNIQVLPEEIEYPKLEILSLRENNKLHRVPDTFFRGIEMLKVLDFTKQIAPLDGQSELEISSLEPLTSLHTLLLQGRHLDNISFIGTLKKIEILILRETTVRTLPVEIREFACLRLLDLTKCKHLKIVPANVISGLSRLEELFMGQSFDNWDREDETGEGRNASLSELHLLPRLSMFCVQIKDIVQLLPANLGHLKAANFELSVGSDSKQFYPTSRTLTVKGNFDLDGLKTLLILAENLSLDYLDLKANLNDIYQTEGDYILTDLNKGGLNSLKSLRVSHFKWITSLTSSGKVVFANLEEVFLGNLKGMRSLGVGVLPSNSLGKLRLLTIEECDGLRGAAITSDWVHVLEKLEIVTVEHSKYVTVIFENKEIANDSEDTLLISLRKLRLTYLPDLLTVCYGSVNLSNLRVVDIKHCAKLVSVFSSNVFHSISHLEELRIALCADLVEIFADTGDTNEFIKFPNLKVVSVGCCDSLRSIFTVSTARSLKKLEELTVYYTDGLVEIVSGKENIQEDGNKEVIIWPQLRKMFLGRSKSLRRFCPSNCYITLPLLKQLSFSIQTGMKNFASDPAAYGLKVSQSAEMKCLA